MNESDMPPEPVEPPPLIKSPWWLTDKGTARMRELENELQKLTGDRNAKGK